MLRCTPARLAAAAATIATLATAVPSPAHADVRSGPALEGKSRQKDEQPRRWYGWQVMAADALTFAAAGSTALVTDAVDGEPRAVGGAVLIGGYTLGGPLVHLMQRRYGRAAGSLGVRLAAPIAFGLVGHYLDTADMTDDSDDGIGDSARIGVAIGTGAALILDWMGMAWAPVDERPARAARVVPTATASSGGLSLGVAGHF